MQIAVNMYGNQGRLLLLYNRRNENTKIKEELKIKASLSY